MDTKWNSMDKDPSEALEQFVADQIREASESVDSGVHVISVDNGSEGARRVRAVIAFLAFVLGVSLVLGSLGAAAGRLLAQRDGTEWWKDDWQETEAFREEISSYLREFLTLGAGGTLSWYDTEVVREYGYDATLWSAVSYEDFAVSGTSVPASEIPLDDPDHQYENDKNVLYRIINFDTLTKYSNAGDASLAVYHELPEGYNFLLTFQDGKVSIVKDGTALDVYGGGIYDEDSPWFVPGYDNFPAGEGVENVSVYMAVREMPVRYYTGDYQNGGYYQSSRMYYITQSIQEARAFYFRQTALLGAGLLCLALWFVLRREKKLADRRIASWTVHVWTEVRFLAVAAALVCLLLPSAGAPLDEVWWEIRYAGLYSDMLPYIGRALLAHLENTGPLLALVWVLWLIRNDHRHNPKAKRRSLWRMVSVHLPKYTFQKRANRRNRAAVLLACVLPAAGLLLAVSMNISPVHWLFYVLVVIPAVAAVLIWLALRKNAALARDIGLLSDQVEAIHSGDLSTPLDLPEDADLRQTAEALNDIQAGLHRALEEQTHSERMKVELVSNVSHDLKTPLTSILSYAELLRQEELTGAAADYARIIDEKAQRLKSMVQDVFDISKAAASQLPVQLERLDLAKLLRQTLADMDDPIRASQLAFKLDLPETPVMIVADGRRLYRVFQNLIQNALQYALEGSRVYLTLRTGAGKAEASVRNTSRDELPEGVDFTARFVRGDTSRTDGGSGLGLSIASSFTEACGGEFRAETVADLFTAIVTFPLAE